MFTTVQQFFCSVSCTVAVKCGILRKQLDSFLCVCWHQHLNRIMPLSPVYKQQWPNAMWLLWNVTHATSASSLWSGHPSFVVCWQVRPITGSSRPRSVGSSMYAQCPCTDNLRRSSGIIGQRHMCPVAPTSNQTQGPSSKNTYFAVVPGLIFVIRDL